MRTLVLFLFILQACSPAGNRSGGGDTVSFGAALNGLSMQHFVDPETGNISEKLSIPKNYSGNLYLAVDSVDELTDKHLFAKMRFGYLREHTKIIPATIGVAPGLIPGTTQPVLILSLSSRPFYSIPLEYDLYDYNSYNFTSNVVPIEQNNRDKDLYCRGLRIEDDPTTTSNSCSRSGDRCLYGFAKIEDKGWFQVDGQQYTNVLEPQVALGGGIYGQDPSFSFLTKCLSDQASQAYYQGTNPATLVNFGSPVNIDGSAYSYQGPFRAVNSFQWEIESDAVWNSQYGLFQQSLGPIRNLDQGYRSFLFPRYSKLSIGSETEHIGSDKAGNVSELKEGLDNDGKSFWMSGCNLRVTTRDERNEHIGSCNVTADIEIFYRDGGDEVIVSSSRWDNSSKQVKLQLLQEGELASSNSIMNPAYRTCSSNSTCADNECCYNGRCWSDELVACSDEGQIGSRGVGQSCTSANGSPLDSICASFCCRGPLPGSGEESGILCRPHGNGASCNKPIGMACILSETCEVQVVTQERLIQESNLAGDCRVRTCKSCESGTCDSSTLTCQNNTQDGATLDNINVIAPDCSTATPKREDWVCQGDPGYETFTCP